ncbi:hypothetical protein ANCDUO_03435 [Ancylostoma duodenale]|uniref:Uncharacterized protein n=1 Tax=Ancylostoma duodenale TaxID=51022 RepID=A0A0C2D918_9BILA|nr:hypothetical protein ANCDUO_03435 [Ancylostoma duodenale]
MRVRIRERAFHAKAVLMSTSPNRHRIWNSTIGEASETTVWARGFSKFKYEERPYTQCCPMGRTSAGSALPQVLPFGLKQERPARCPACVLRAVFLPPSLNCWCSPLRPARIPSSSTTSPSTTAAPSKRAPRAAPLRPAATGVPECTNACQEEVVQRIKLPSVYTSNNHRIFPSHEGTLEKFPSLWLTWTVCLRTANTSAGHY